MATTGKRGIILMNLGSPDSTSVRDVRRYLNEFLMDKRVIDIPWLQRAALVKGIITPFRAPKSAHAYKTIWTKEGSPLIVITKQLQEAVQKLTSDPVEIAMRYGNPTPKVAFDALMNKVEGLEEVILFPLYPHYALASYETAIEYAKEIHAKNKYPFRLTIIPPYFNDPSYIKALSESMQPYLQQDYDHILFSYHGIPARHLHNRDVAQVQQCVQAGTCLAAGATKNKNCYRYEVFETTRLVTEALRIPKDKYSLSFQSRLGKGWLEPFTDIRLEQMPKEGIRKLLIVSPAFVSDCLETLEELEIRGKEIFIGAGGESYQMIPCMNVHPDWVSTVAKLVSI
ncbi:MAG: ferrochelatase [Bacteroidetes bacterium]|nr:ferrochelatase [Bacteroidota bacterium]